MARLACAGTLCAWHHHHHQHQQSSWLSAECRARRVEDDYKVGDELGSGSFAVVMMGTCRRTGKQVAIKRIPKQKQSEDSVRKEVAILSRVGMHRSIAQLENFYEADDAFYVVMEFVDGGELFDALCEQGSYSERDAASLVRQVAGAVALLHAQGLCHADIKPENLLLMANGDVKLVDFGLSCELRDAKDKKPGTWAYWPPEAFHAQLGLPTDMWAMGVVLYILLAGFHPFDPEGDADDHVVMTNIRNCKLDLFADEAWSDISEPAKSLVRGLLRRDPAERLTVEQVLQHPWILAGGAPDAKLEGSDARLGKYRKSTASLRAAVFATMLKQEKVGGKKVGAKLTSGGAVTGRMASGMIEADILSSAFKVFDPEGKGFITQTDLQRVLKEQGAHVDQGSELRSMLTGAAEGDREGERVTYGDYVNLMGMTGKLQFSHGQYIFRQGDKADGFLLLLSGDVEVVLRDERGREQVVNTLHEGDFFGETALLSDAPRNASMRAKGAVEVLMLSKEDFEAGFIKTGAKQKHAAMQQTLGFIQMVSRMQQTVLQRDECVFREGEPGDCFYIVGEGSMRVESGGKHLARLSSGECFGEMALLSGEPRNATVRCISSACNVTSMARDDFLQLMQRSTALRGDMQRLATGRSETNVQQLVAPPVAKA